MGFTIQRSGYTRTPEMLYAIVQDLLANGFVQCYPAAPVLQAPPGSIQQEFAITLEAGPTVNALIDQPWRIHFNTKGSLVNQTSSLTDDDLLGQSMDVIIATPTQLKDDGTTAFLDNTDSGGWDGTLVDKMQSGLLTANMMLRYGTGTDVTGSGYNYPGTTKHVPGSGTVLVPAVYDLVMSHAAPKTVSDVHFIARNYTGRITTAEQAMAYPMSYAMSITDHGLSIMTWEEAADASTFAHSSWFVVQRPVDHITGVPLAVGHCPVFCLFSMNNSMMKFVVRENDVTKPTRPVFAGTDMEDSHAIINGENQVVITENNRYILSFPNGLNTSRYMYTEELDMVSYTSADVVSHYSDIQMTVYGEAVPRVYKAMQSNAVNNTGMRILLIAKGAGIP